MFQVRKVGGGHFALVAPHYEKWGANAPSAHGSVTTDFGPCRPLVVCGIQQFKCLC